MNKTKKYVLKSLLFTLVSVLFISSVSFVFAAFFVTTTFDGDFDLYELTINDNSANSTYSITTINSSNFTAPGDEREIQINLNSNANEKNLHYYFKLVLDIENSNGFQNAIMIYFDDVFFGTLSSLCNLSNNYTGKIDNDSYILTNERLTNCNSIKFVLHNAADGSYYDTSNNLHPTEGSYFTASNYFNVDVVCCIENINVQSKIFVNNETEFKRAIDDINLSNRTDKEIKLASDITLTKDYNIYNSCKIDLFGHTLTFNGGSNGAGSITLTDPPVLSDPQPAYTVILDNSRDSITAPAGNTGIIINSTYAILDIKDKVSDYGSKVSIDEFNEDGVLDLIASYVKNKLENDIYSGISTPVTILQGLSFYSANNILSLFSQPDYTYSNYTIVKNEKIEKTINTNITLTIGSSSVPIYFKIIGNNNDDLTQNYFKTIVETDLQYLSFLSDGNGTDEISFDLFLPTSIKKYNAVIVWWSSDESILSSTGKLPESAQGNVDLVALIKINDKTYTKNYRLYVVKQSEEMLFQYLLATIGTIKLSNIYNEQNPLTYEMLPIVNENSQYDYRIMYTNGDDIKIESLSYGPLEPMYNYLLLDEKTINDPSGNIDDYNVPFIALSQATFQLYAQLPITAYFKGDRDGDGIENIDDPDYIPQTGNIGVEILLGSNSQLQEDVFTYIQTVLDNISVLNNILSTRETHGILNETGDFSLTNAYMGFTISYRIPSSYTTGSYSIDENGIDLHFHPRYFPINDSQAPINVTISINGLNPNYDENDPESQEYILVETDKNLYINLPGAIHNNSGGFNNARLFYAIKLQVLQQLANPATLDGTTYIDTSTTYQDIVETGDYILRYDIENCKTLIIEYGEDAVVTYDDIDEIGYTAIIEWATSTTNAGQDVGDVATITSDHAWLSSDGLSTISDVEATAILKFCECYDYFDTIWKTYINVNDNNLTSDELSYLQTILTDFGYNLLIDWATSINISTARAVLDAENISSTNLSTRNLSNDGNSTINEAEQSVILEYCSDQGYTNYESVWRGTIDNSTTAGYSNYSINLNRKDDELSSSDITALNNFISTDTELVGVNNILDWARSVSNNVTYTFNGINYTNDRVQHYTSKNPAYLPNYISDNEYNLIKAYFIHMGYYNDDNTFDSYFATKNYFTGWFLWFGTGGTNGTVLEDNGVASLIALAKSQQADANLTSLYNWAKGNTSVSASNTVASLTGTPVANLLSDGNSTISRDEQTAILYYSQNKATSPSLLKRADANIQALINWATSTSGGTTAQSIVPSLSGSAHEDTTNDNSNNISEDEINAISYYYQNATYNQSIFIHPNYQTEWERYIDLSYWDNELSTTDLLNLSNEITGNLDLDEYNDVIGWIKGFGENYTELQASTVGSNITTNANSVADGLSTLNEIELATLIEYVTNIGLTNNVLTNYLNYLGTCVDLSSRDNTLTQSEQDNLLQYVRSIRLHGDFYDLINWATSTTADYSARKIAPSLNPSVSDNLADGLATISENEMAVLLEHCLDNGYTRLYEELYTNGLDISLVPELIRYYYIPVTNINNATTGLRYFTNLRRLLIHSDSNGSLLTVVPNGDEFINYGDNLVVYVSAYAQDIYRIDLRYLNLTTMTPLQAIPNITHLDLRGNEDITDISNIALTNIGNLQYLNIYDTSVNFYYSECIIADAYFQYRDTHSQGINIFTPWYFYKNIDKLQRYSPPNGLDAEDVLPMYYCFLLKEIINFDSQYLQLPSDVFVLIDDSVVSYSLDWHAESGSIQIINIGSGQKSVENLLTSNTSIKNGLGILSVTISVQQGALLGSYTRYFTINLTNPNYIEP